MVPLASSCLFWTKCNLSSQAKSALLSLQNARLRVSLYITKACRHLEIVCKTAKLLTISLIQWNHIFWRTLYRGLAENPVDRESALRTEGTKKLAVRLYLCDRCAGYVEKITIHIYSLKKSVSRLFVSVEDTSKRSLQSQYAGRLYGYTRAHFRNPSANRCSTDRGPSQAGPSATDWWGSLATVAPWPRTGWRFFGSSLNDTVLSHQTNGALHTRAATIFEGVVLRR